MPDDLLIARNPEEGSSLPYLIRIPIDGGLVLKARETWPRTSKVYCHRATGWPDDAEIVERLPIRTVSKRGAAIDLVLTRQREARSQFVLTRARGREMIFWQSARTAKQARPQVSLPTARAHGQVLQIVVDSGEKYPYKFSHQQAEVRRQRLTVGDYAVLEDDEIVGTVERKTVADLSGTLLGGRMDYLLADLAALPYAAVVVEEGYSKVFKIPGGRSTSTAEALAEAQARFPTVPILFLENRSLAQEWVYRWFGACLTEWRTRRANTGIGADIATAPEAVAQLGPRPPSASELRVWARARGIEVPDRGRIPHTVRDAWFAAHG
ncbi:ERCC4 domain-containing protein [Microlunatus soli]|uniref:ERCC4 domain-containing protein n=1 Tax=Microlunatus soli TaxID=630515 RepID=A0A1H1S330_9ACTN|nr:ERCC4 domain-containing protein [Microlunatus soli]SDS42480.1 ERCC4 domain-containing protein [Microlunatus soli]